MALKEFENAHEMMQFYRDLRIKFLAPRPSLPPSPEPASEPPPPPPVPLTPIRRIVLAVAHEFDLPVQVLCSRTNVASVVVARHVAVFLAKELTNASHYQIGKAIGHRDHSCIRNSVASLKGKMIKNPALGLRVERLRRRLLEEEHHDNNGSEQDSQRARDCGSRGPDVVPLGTTIGGEGNGFGNV